jgi:hypothetical protein
LSHSVYFVFTYFVQKNSMISRLLDFSQIFSNEKLAQHLGWNRDNESQ